jgi:KUP system potassium uptake protein
MQQLMNVVTKITIISLVLSIDAVVVVSIIILVALFSIQQFGTGKVGFLFAPVLGLWFFSLGSIGIYNLVKHDISVIRALNPAYIYFFFKKNSGAAWSALGGCVLCITGTYCPKL